MVYQGFLRMVVGLAFCLLLGSLGSFAGDIEHSEYRGRREALADQLRKQLPPGERGVLLLRAAEWDGETTLPPGK